jgi:hypothetical protein
MASNDHDDIIVLKKEMETMSTSFNKLVDKFEILSDDLKTFKNLITTGKWLFGTILLTLGAMGHKSVDWIHSLIYGN